ncbi:glycosyltransferase [Planktomarina temperata]|nr:glycosyltransferase [Planktomarina temperata]MDB2459785.1 glycosyltransferase [Planktomarina temperata]
MYKKFKEVILFGTKPQVPFNILTKDLLDIDEGDNLTKFRDELLTANLVIITGWSHKTWIKIIAEVKKKNPGLKVCLSVDNNLRKTFRQRIGKYYFKFFISSIADFYFVAGRSSFDLLKFFDVPDEKIFFGYYGSYSKLYYPQGLNDRHGFVFVGQKIERKGIDTLRQAYKLYKSELNGRQCLKVVGGSERGSLDDLVEHGYSETGFLQPQDTAKVLSQSKTLILPSRVEHWGTIVCEAAACGCSLLLSDKIGSRLDMLLPGVNGFSFHVGDIRGLANSMKKFDQLPNFWHLTSSEASISLASAFDERAYCAAVVSMLES